MSAKRGKLHADIGVIGGSGLYGMEGLDGVREVRPSTPFGRPSDALVLGTVGGVQVAFLARHGRGHRLSPSEINYRANIYALKSVGVTRVISVSAVGSMKEGLKPGEIVLPDQFVDHTKRRASTFFDRGIVAHVAFSDPICQALAAALFRAARETGVVVHKGGVYFCIEGPQFSTRGESLLYRQWGVDVIGMTNMPEAKLAREARGDVRDHGSTEFGKCAPAPRSDGLPMRWSLERSVGCRLRSWPAMVADIASRRVRSTIAPIFMRSNRSVSHGSSPSVLWGV